MGFWETVGATILGLAASGLLAWGATALFQLALRRLGKKPDWTLSRDAFGTLVLTRARRRTAYDVHWTLFGENGTTLLDDSTGNPSAKFDYAKGESMCVEHVDGELALALRWIDTARRQADINLTSIEDGQGVTAARSK